MKCHNIENLMPLLLEKSLKGPLLSKVNSHIENCPNCQSIISEIKNTERILEDVRSSIPAAPIDFTSKIMSSISEKPEAIRKSETVAILFASVSFVAFVLTLIPVFIDNPITVLAPTIHSLIAMGRGILALWNIPIWIVTVGSTGLLLWTISIPAFYLFLSIHTNPKIKAAA